MATFETIKLDKGLYQSSAGFLNELEKVDPSENYKGTSLENLDAFERQLKRFDIKIKGKDSSPLEKFFQTSDSAVLFPEYVSRTVRQGLMETNIIDSMIATRTEINGLDYRTIYNDRLVYNSDNMGTIAEGNAIPEARINTKSNLVHLKKRGRMLVASYEAVRFQRLDIFSIALRAIGANLANVQVGDAIRVLAAGDGNDNPTNIIYTENSGVLSYKDLVNAWKEIAPYTMNTIVTSQNMAATILNLPEMRDAAAGLNFHATGKMITPLGAKILASSEITNDVLIAFDKNYSLEMVTAGGITTEFDKLIDRQLHRAAITETYGFAKILSDASIGMALTEIEP